MISDVANGMSEYTKTTSAAAGEYFLIFPHRKSILLLSEKRKRKKRKKKRGEIYIKCYSHRFIVYFIFNLRECLIFLLFNLVYN